MDDSGAHYHVGVVVPDIEAAMAELTAAVGATWSEVTTEQVGDASVRQTFTTEGPPYVELIEAAPGSMWDPAGAPRLDHVGWWVDDAEAAKRRLVDAGFALDGDGAPHGRAFSYHRLPASGIRLEVVDRSRRARVEGRIHGEPANVVDVYPRIYVRDLNEGMALVRRTPDEEPSLRFTHGSGLELARIGGVLVVAGPDEVLDEFRATALTAIVRDLDAALAFAAEHHAEVVRPEAKQPTGRNATVRYPAGPQIEYVEFAGDGARHPPAP